MAVVVVEEAEVVDVDEGDPERRRRRPGPPRCSSARRPTRAPWFRVPVRGSRRVDSTRAAVWRVSRPWADRKTKKQEHRGDDAGREGDEDDVAADVVEAGRGSAPASRQIADDRPDLAVGADRQELPQDGRCRRGEVRPRTSARPARSRPSGSRGGGGEVAGGRRHRRRTAPPPAGPAALAATIVPSGQAQLDAEDLAGPVSAASSARARSTSGRRSARPPDRGRAAGRRR